MGMAIMGSRTLRWRSALWGSVCATLPDLDVLIPYGDPVRDMTFHRAETHALFYLALAAPLIAWVISRIHKEAALFRRWWLATWAVLSGHALLDLMTTYGTQIALPFTDHPYRVGSIFVIDPLFTLPVLIGALIALCRRSPRAARWNIAGLLLSVAYLSWTVLAQQHVARIAHDSLRAQGIVADRIEVGPTPFNSILWQVTAMTPHSYAVGFYSLLDKEPRIAFREHPRGEALFERFRDNWHVARMAWFTEGVFRMELQGGFIRITDLRLGLAPFYAFSFAVLRQQGDGFVPISPKPLGTRPPLDAALPWLWRRLKGEPLAPLQPDGVIRRDPRLSAN